MQLFPIFCLLCSQNQTFGRNPRCVREKCAEQPGLLSVNALEQTINIGAIHKSKLKTKRSVLTVPGDTFYYSAFPKF